MKWYSCALSLTPSLYGGGWLKPDLDRCTPGNGPEPFLREAVWVSWPVWTSAEYLARTRMRSLDRSARSESLYRLSYRRPFLGGKQKIEYMLNIRNCVFVFTRELFIYWRIYKYL